MLYLAIKWLHILSSTVLFGTGVGTAFFMFMANKSRNVQAIAFATRTVVLADWLFTTPAVIFQPVSGCILVKMAGYSMTAGWLLAALGLYVFAGLCWLPVVWMQMRMKALAQTALAAHTPLPKAYWDYNLWWLILGSLAFPAVVVIFYLMVATPG